MACKTFFVQVELDIRAVTCPGVWLCANGKVSLQIYLLDSCVQTTSHKPLFPIQFNEKFVFYKTYSIKHRLNVLQKELNQECVYIELIQWQSCETGTVLAKFQTTLDELLYPTTKRSGSIPGIDIDLLMEPTKCYPGKIAPKIEVNTKTTINEKICACKTTNSKIINPKILSSTIAESTKNPPRKVCHSIGYSRRKFPLKTIKRPPFRYRKPDDYLISRKPQGDFFVSKQQQQQQHMCKKKNLEKNTKFSNSKYDCCSICSKYHGYFRLPLTDTTKLKCCDCSENNQRFQENDFVKTCCCCCTDNNGNINNNYLHDCEDDFDDGDGDEKEKKISCLAEQLHERLNKTLETLAEPECHCCKIEDECPTCIATMPDCDNKCANKFDLDLQKFNGNFNEQAQYASNNNNAIRCSSN